MNESSKIEFVRQGVVAPLSRITFAAPPVFGEFNGGVYYSNGNVCQIALHGKTHYHNRPDPLYINKEVKKLDGHHIFGGMLQEHFGHFLTESLGRLWALRRLSSNFQSIVFFHRVPGGRIPGFAKDLISLIAPSTPITLIREPTQIWELAVPEQHEKRGVFFGYAESRELTGPLRLIRGSTQARRIYVSRAGLKPNEGGLLLEDFIERNMERWGYTVVRPESMSLQEQLAAYNSAEELIFAEGSALHLYALVARPEQRIFVIWRRKIAGHFCAQIISFGGPDKIVGTSSIHYLMVPPTGEVHAKAVLKFPELARQLYESDFIPNTDCSIPTASDIKIEIERIERLTRMSYQLRQPTPSVGES